MNRKLLIVVPVAIALVAGAVMLSQRRHQVPVDALTLHGNVDIRQVELAFNASGRIADIRVREGDRVQQGQVLASLDTERLRLALVQAEAQTDAQRQVAARFEAGSRPEEIRQARAQRDAARVAVTDAEAVHRRQLDLVAQNFVSRQQADSAAHALERARAQLKAAEEGVRLAELGPRREDVAAARANLAASEAAANLLRRDLKEGELLAPASGVVENRILEPGDMASPARPVLTLALTDPVWVRVWLPETLLGWVPVGARASVNTDSQPGKAYRAWVGFVSPSAEFTPKSVETTEIRASLVYQARVFVCDGHEALRLGMPATVTIKLDQAPRPQGADPCKAP